MSFIRNARFATLLAVALALVLTGVAAGAAGQALVLGIANNAGNSSTSLTTSSSGAAFMVTQNGSGKALRAASSQGPPLGLFGPSNQPPMTVNSSDKVINLNADRLDGLTSYDFLRSRSYFALFDAQLDPHMEDSFRATCDELDRVLSGGYSLGLPEGEDLPVPDFLIWSNGHVSAGWMVTIENRSDGALLVQVYVQCADRYPYHQP